MCIQSEGVLLCSESILPKSYEEVEQAIHTLVALEEIPKHGKCNFILSIIEIFLHCF